VADKSANSPDVLATLIEKLKGEYLDQVKEEQSDQAKEEESNQEPVFPEWLHSLKEFAALDKGEQRLSAQDINNLKLVAQISTLIRESVAAP
jgi:hypothetical protein